MRKVDDTCSTVRKATGIFLLIFIPLVSLISGLLYLFYALEVSSYDQAVLERQQQIVELNALSASGSLQSVFSDLQLLRQQNELHKYLAGNSEALHEMSSEYLVFSRVKDIFDQVRLIDQSGKEILRINRVNGQPVLVPEHQLQDKSDRYYVQDTLSLGDGGVFVSPLDLNVDAGQVEYPPKPMIRFGTPVFDGGGSLRGAIILNYRARVLLDRLRELNGPVLGETMVLNNDGFWLLNPEPGNEWGFMFDDRKNLRFGVLFPDEWSQISWLKTGQFHSDGGLFTFTTIYPNALVQAFSNSETGRQSHSPSIGSEERYAWKILSHVPEQEFTMNARDVRGRLSGLSATLMLLAVFGSALLTAGILRRSHYHSQMEALAHFDSLTGLPNRALYFDRLDQAMSRAERYQRPLAQLYVDIDNFKHINDGFGHQAGDLALRVVAKRLRQAIRKSDTVARLGGDEFVILLTEVRGRQCCINVAEKIMKLMEQPVNFNGVDRLVTLSVGISLFPEDGDDGEALLNKADQAMYQSKTNGKNQYHCGLVS